MKRADSIDPAKILAAMPTTNYDGAIGNVQFDAHGDLKHGVISMYGYKSGKRALIGVEQM